MGHAGRRRERAHVALACLGLAEHLLAALVHELLGDLLEREQEHLLVFGLVGTVKDGLLAALDLDGVLQVCQWRGE